METRPWPGGAVACPVHQKVGGLVPGLGVCLGSGSVPGWGGCGRRAVDVSHIDVSLSLTLKSVDILKK